MKVLIQPKKIDSSGGRLKYCNAVSSKFRHPERSEAKDLFSSCGVIRAQSKDPATFPSNYCSEMSSLYSRQTSRHGTEMPCPNAAPIDWTTRSFDFGSVKLFGKTPVPLAFAQDDGIFKTNISFRVRRTGGRQ